MTLLSVLKKTNNKTKHRYNYPDNLETLKHFPSSVREWDNSIFVYNKNAIPLVPHISKLAIKLIRSYFSLYDLYLEKLQ